MFPLPEAPPSRQAGRDGPESEGPGSAWAWRQGVYTRVQACLRVSPRSKSSPEVTWRRLRWQWRKAAGWQARNAKPPSRVESGRPRLGASHPPRPAQVRGSHRVRSTCHQGPGPGQRLSPESQQWILRALSPPGAPGGSAVSLCPTPSPTPRPSPGAVCLQPPASSSKSSVVIFFFFINVIYKDGSSKKAEMRRLGGSGSWLRSCPPPRVRL